MTESERACERYRVHLERIVRRYLREGDFPCQDSTRWGLSWAMFQDACEALGADHVERIKQGIKLEFANRYVP